MRILGLDPGSRVTGYGLVKAETKPQALAWGVISLPTRAPLAERLARLYQELCSLLEKLRPEVIALEEVIPERYPRAILSLGQAQGVVLLLAGQRGLPFFLYHPGEIKKALTGNGRAAKTQITYMVSQLLALEPGLPPDAADALAVALTHFYRGQKAIRDSGTDR